MDNLRSIAEIQRDLLCFVLVRMTSRMYTIWGRDTFNWLENPIHQYM